MQFRRLVWKSGLQAYPKKNQTRCPLSFYHCLVCCAEVAPLWKACILQFATVPTSVLPLLRGHFYNHPFGAAVPDIGIWDPDTIDRTESSKYVLPRGNLHLYWEVLATVSLKLFIPQTLMFATKSMAQNGDQVKFKRFPDSWT